MWLLDPLPGWLPTRNHLSRLAQSPKHHLADPAMAARLVGVGIDALLSGGEGTARVPRDGTLLESLVTSSVRVHAQAAGARVHHLRHGTATTRWTSSSSARTTHHRAPCVPSQ